MGTTRTIAVTGVSEHDAARFATLIERHRHKLDANWESGHAADADLLLVDIESAYGQMDWLRARSRGRLVIAYTSAIEPLEPEFSLRKPVVSGDLIALLNRFGPGTTKRPDPSITMPSANSATYEPAEVAPEPPKPALAAVVATAAPIDAPRAKPAPETFFIDELLDKLADTARPVRLVAEGLPSIIIDPEHRRWHAGVGLKALTGWCKRALTHDQPIPLDPAEFASAIEILPGQAYSRLVWFAHLARGEGRLSPSLPQDGRYRLTRWPQVEREFPKHFRIATAMMRGTGTIEEIAAQSAADPADVADFINAYHALGFIETDAMMPAAMAADRSGLFDRMRKSLRT